MKSESAELKKKFETGILNELGGWSKDQKWINIGIAIVGPIIALFVYNIIISQLFVFEK